MCVASYYQRERVCSILLRERERKRECVCVWGRERETVCVCVWICVYRFLD